MSNSHCASHFVAPLASIAREICPFPRYTFSNHFPSMLSMDSSRYLQDHYREVQNSLTPRQLEDFTQGLRRTFGREGRVTLGGVGVVALALAVLFDTLAKQVRGESVSESGPIPGLFVKDLRGYYPPQVYTIGEYLRMVPHIANNPTRMIEVTEGYLRKLSADNQVFRNLGENSTLPVREDITSINLMLSLLVEVNLNIHLIRIKNGTTFMEMPTEWYETRYVQINLNCDPEAIEKDFLAEVQKSDNGAQEALENCKQKEGSILLPLVQHVVELRYKYNMFGVFNMIGRAIRNVTADSVRVQNQDFDLRANALGEWPV